MVQFGYESFDWHRYLVLLAVLVGPVRGQHAIGDIVHFQFLAIALSPVDPLMSSESERIGQCGLYFSAFICCNGVNIPLSFVDVKLPYGDC